MLIEQIHLCSSSSSVRAVHKGGGGGGAVEPTLDWQANEGLKLSCES